MAFFVSLVIVHWKTESKFSSKSRVRCCSDVLEADVIEYLTIDQKDMGSVPNGSVALSFT